MLWKYSWFNYFCMGGEKIEKVEEVICKFYGYFLIKDSLFIVIYIRYVKCEFDFEYYSEEELNFVDLCFKVGVISINVVCKKFIDVL